MVRDKYSNPRLQRGCVGLGILMRWGAARCQEDHRLPRQAQSLRTRLLVQPLGVRFFHDSIGMSSWQNHTSMCAYCHH